MEASPTTREADTDVALPELSSGQRRWLWLGTGVALLGSLLLIVSFFLPWVQLMPYLARYVGSGVFYAPSELLSGTGEQFVVVPYLVPLVVAAALGLFALGGLLTRRPGYLPRMVLGGAILACLASPIAELWLLGHMVFQEALVVVREGAVLALAGFGCVFVGAVLLSIGRRGELVDYYHQLRIAAAQRPARWKPPAFWAGAALIPVGSLSVVASLFVPWAPGSIEYADQQSNFFALFGQGGLLILALYFLTVVFFALVPALSALAGILRHQVSVKLRLELDCAKVACVIGLITTLTILGDVFDPNAVPAAQSGWMLAVAGFAGILVGAVLLGIGRSESLEDYY